MKETRIKRFNENSELNISDVSDSGETITLTKKELKKFIEDCFDRAYGGDWSETSKRIAVFLKMK
jgi:hypoxanthine phosphoribosyltransferase